MGGNVEAYYDARWEAEQRELKEKRDRVNADDWMSWDEYYMNIAHAVKLKSKDKHTQIGAVIIGTQGEILSTGYNSIPRGLDDFVPERYERPEKYNWMEHAERNAIYNAARTGVSTIGSKMYMTCGLSCMDCARAIIQAGIVEIHIIPGTGAKSTPNVNSNVTSVMFEEAKVKVVEHEDRWSEKLHA